MNGWAKVQFSIAAVATLGFVAVGVHGLRVAGDVGGFAVHAQLALLVTLALVLGQAWLALFVIAAERRLRPLLPAGARARGDLARVRDRVATAALVAVAASLAHFALAGRLFATHSPGWVHGSAALAALVAQCAALAVEARELTRHQRLVAGVVEGEEAVGRVLDSARS